MAFENDGEICADIHLVQWEYIFLQFYAIIWRQQRENFLVLEISHIRRINNSMRSIQYNEYQLFTSEQRHKLINQQ